MTRLRRHQPDGPTPSVRAVPRGGAGHVDPRLQRVRRLAWILDRSIPLGPNLRIGLDPLIGLLPAGGDAIGALISLFIVWEGARLGLPRRVIARMLGNVALEGIVGAVPLLGDLFDAAWQANMRNVRLIEQHYEPDRPDRPVGRIAWGVIAISLLLVVGIVALAAWVLTALWRWLS